MQIKTIHYLILSHSSWLGIPDSDIKPLWYVQDCCIHFLLYSTLIILCMSQILQIHLMTFQGTRYCAKDPTLVNPDEIKAARGELQPPYTRDN